MNKIISQFDFEKAVAAELKQHIETGDEQKRRNESTPKTVKSTSGNFQLDTPRDHNGTFEPQLVKKHQIYLTNEIERKILSLFELGNRQTDPGAQRMEATVTR